nr:hypothetical protein CFP56_43382 [Quercus suber]
MNGRVFRSIPPNLPSLLAPTFNSQPKLKSAIKQGLNSWIQIPSILACPSTLSVGTSHLSTPSLIKLIVGSLVGRQKFYLRPPASPSPGQSSHPFQPIGCPLSNCLRTLVPKLMQGFVISSRGSLIPTATYIQKLGTPFVSLNLSVASVSEEPMILTRLLFPS